MTGGYIRVTFIVTPEDDGYVSYCPELAIASQGDTVDEAFRNMEDATLTYLNTIEALGERRRVFKERGVRVLRSQPKKAITLELQPSQIGSSFVTEVPTGSRRSSLSVA